MVFSKTNFTIHTIMKNVNDRLTTSILAAKVEIVLLDLRRQKKNKTKNKEFLKRVHENWHKNNQPFLWVLPSNELSLSVECGLLEHVQLTLEFWPVLGQCHNGITRKGNKIIKQEDQESCIRVIIENHKHPACYEHDFSLFVDWMSVK